MKNNGGVGPATCCQEQEQQQQEQQQQQQQEKQCLPWALEQCNQLTNHDGYVPPKLSMFF